MLHATSHPAHLGYLRAVRAGAGGLLAAALIYDVLGLAGQIPHQQGRQLGWAATALCLTVVLTAHCLLASRPRRAWVTITIAAAIWVLGTVTEEAVEARRDATVSSTWRAAYVYPTVGVAAGGVGPLLVMPAWASLTAALRRVEEINHED